MSRCTAVSSAKGCSTAPVRARFLPRRRRIKCTSAARAIDGGAGVLLLIKNYTGDVLNFETATELLHDSGVAVATVLVDDDVAVKDSLFTAGRRGVANTVLMEKLLGAAAARGDDLDSVVTLGHRINNHGHSIGIALGACTVPAAGKAVVHPGGERNGVRRRHSRRAGHCAPPVHHAQRGGGRHVPYADRPRPLSAHDPRLGSSAGASGATRCKPSSR